MQSSELNLQIWKANSEIFQERQTKIISRGSKLTQESKGNARDRKVRVMLERQESSGNYKDRKFQLTLEKGKLRCCQRQETRGKLRDRKARVLPETGNKG